MEQQFRFCGAEYRVLSETPLELRGDLELFRSRGGADVVLTCRRVEQVEPAGKLLGVSGEKSAWRDGEIIQRCTMSDAGRKPYAMLRYREDGTERAELLARRQEWSWLGGLQFWIAAQFPQLLLHRGAVMFHASYIAYEGQGIIFTAPSQTGKSTQAELWRKHRGAEILNGDKAGVTPGPAGAMVHSLPFSGTSGICKNRSLPLRAIVVLSQAPVNAVRRMGPSEAVTALCGNIFADKLVPEEWTMALNLLLDLLVTVPVYHLACTPDVRAVEALEAAFER